MPQQTSPFIEGKYGWSYGESGWNSGMDENLNKFSFMFDGNVDGIVGSLPSLVNGQAYFLTTDNRFYFAVGGVYYSSPCPKHFIFKIKSTGDFYQFDGLTTTQIDTPAELNNRLSSVELTISTLGTAAFEDVVNLATQAELDIAIANAANYTDTLRNDLADTTDPAKGAALVGFNIDSPGFSGTTVAEYVANSFPLTAFGASTIAADNLEAWQSAIDYSAASGRRLIVDGVGDYLVSDHPLLKSGAVIEWVSNSAWLKLSGASTTGAVLTCGNVDVVNVAIINPHIDAASIPGQNGIGIDGAGGTENIRVIGGVIKNCKRSPVNGGGRAVTIQLGAKNITARGYKALNCTTAGDVHGWGAVANSEAKDIIFAFEAENCDEVFSGFDLQATGSDDSDYNLCIVEDFIARNCGIPDPLFGAATDGAAIIIERGSYIHIMNGVIVNDSTYGTIGSVVRGKGYHCDINIKFIGDCLTLVNGTNATTMAPVTGNSATPFNDNVITIDHVGSCTNLVDGESSAKFNRNSIDVFVSTLSGNAVGAGVSGSTNSYLSTVRHADGFKCSGALVDFSTYFPTLDVTFRNAFGNLFRTGNFSVNISGGAVLLNTLADQDMTFSRNGSARLRLKTLTVNFPLVPTYADNTAATAGGLVVGDVYKTSTGQLMVKY